MAPSKVLIWTYHLSFCDFYSLQEMNVSSANVTAVVDYRDSFAKAVIKNVIVVLLSLLINYINTGLIYTFYEHQVSPAFDDIPRCINLGNKNKIKIVA